ncbi:MAG TPA: rRNA maturation RNase YbeY [Steroidobacteraceae bacterium]|nr:rRNA maturation RNase YbeY [Steroidobacteraceae bacterium]
MSPAAASDAQRARASRRPAGARALRVDVLRGRGWAPAGTEIGAWARAALGRRAPGRELAVRLVAARESRELNARYRGRDHATNVLSFPVGATASSLPAPQPLGDLVICPQVVRAEARAQGKSVRAHWAHLIVHGALHLIGYDHLEPRDARRMERREIRVLRRLGFANPYRST